MSKQESKAQKKGYRSFSRLEFIEGMLLVSDALKLYNKKLVQLGNARTGDRIDKLGFEIFLYLLYRVAVKGKIVKTKRKSNQALGESVAKFSGRQKPSKGEMSTALTNLRDAGIINYKTGPNENDDIVNTDRYVKVSLKKRWLYKRAKKNFLVKQDLTKTCN